MNVFRTCNLIPRVQYDFQYLYSDGCCSKNLWLIFDRMFFSTFSKKDFHTHFYPFTVSIVLLGTDLFFYTFYRHIFNFLFFSADNGVSMGFQSGKCHKKNQIFDIFFSEEFRWGSFFYLNLLDHNVYDKKHSSKYKTYSCNKNLTPNSKVIQSVLSSEVIFRMAPLIHSSFT